MDHYSFKVIISLSFTVFTKLACCNITTDNVTIIPICKSSTFALNNHTSKIISNEYFSPQSLLSIITQDINVGTKSLRSIRNIVTTSKPKKQKILTRIVPRSTPKPGKEFNKSVITQNTTTSGPKTDKRLSVVKNVISNQSEEIIFIESFQSKYPIYLWKEHGFYTDDYIKLINKYWFKFPPTSPFAHYTMAILYTIITAVGCFGNALVIIMYIRCKSLQTPANVLIINLAVSDFFMVAKSPVVIYNSIYQGPALGKLGCKLYGFFGGLTGIGSIMTLAAISLDRYYVIVHPLNSAVKTTKSRARILIALIWLYGFIFSILPTLDIGFSHYTPEGFLSSCSFDYLTDDIHEKRFILIFFTAAWVVPFTLIFFCYVQILSAVWSKSELTASRFGQEVEKRKTEIRLGYVVVGVIMLWFLSWTPYAFMALLGVFDHKEYITPFTSMIPALFCKTAAGIDPWVYAITHPRFKKELLKIFSRKKNRKLERDYGMKKGAEIGIDRHTRSYRTQSSTEDEDIEEVVVMVNPDHKMHRQGSTSSHKTNETKALETKFPPTRQESLKYMPPSWYKLPRSKSKSSIKINRNSIEK
ncbi:opsin, ultraviolet-sensitive-like [Daktulosphaira vitifoliae]|uniref:opsin, ultraviolet-sensitive-like n=1 Tax=Daktulosphaira vitifoliae TaxID=58002 RepID=UPI0021A9E341|nr:opsin, ultraviolet-sensitive-like [Daktulosphaira vitifoliae]XP_050520534.1 opsin, ultraviolet-sensitive-like [Daktulosphaira vitifoliae]XP_050520535.1 opsin, ultraviolet-sensitive-like [Daktulosphaira vitifoliae]XP_050520536.1 opsin, ultraviolet-sensitive-like [Daktulosphaira vitifoliae]XP_050520537.1 opsin, ultraviolet-sensitive-like [Daktulosphaira vitifoliae]XP_050520538.1 opsin, ultraviolet-sensitive-like [Daktulosphaira vitifoliae]